MKTALCKITAQDHVLVWHLINHPEPQSGDRKPKARACPTFYWLMADIANWSQAPSRTSSNTALHKIDPSRHVRWTLIAKPKITVYQEKDSRSGNHLPLRPAITWPGKKQQREDMIPVIEPLMGWQGEDGADFSCRQNYDECCPKWERMLSRG